MEAKPGRGQRACPACSAICGVRSRICNGCGYVFHEISDRDNIPESEPRVVKTFTEAGPGRKPCPCGTFVGVRSASCPACGHAFRPAESAPPDAATRLASQKEGLEGGGDNESSLPATGTKSEPSRRATPTPDDRDDAPSTTYIRPKPGKLSMPLASHDLPYREPERRYRGLGLHRIAIPAGECPAKLTGLTREAVAAWIDAVQVTFRRRNEELTPYGYEYWLRDFHDLGTPEHKTACALIEDIMGATVETY